MPYLPDAEVADEIAYGLRMRKLQELSLSDESMRGARVIRFAWLQSFGHPLVLRVDIDSDDAGQLRIKVGGGSGGKLTHDVTRPLGTAEIDSLLSLLTTGDFWNASPKLDHLGMDGEEWILEVRERERYHYINRWCPEDGVAFVVGHHLARLARDDLERM